MKSIQSIAGFRFLKTQVTTQAKTQSNTRRNLILGAAILVVAKPASAQLSEGDASAGIRAALTKGAAAAISKLSLQDGFLKDRKSVV